MPFQPRSTRRSSGRGSKRRPSGRKQRFDVVCTNCDTATVVPFRPKPGRPVYCRPCFDDIRAGKSAGNDSPADDLPASIHPSAGQAADVATAFPGIELKPASRAAIAAMGIVEPTPIQERCIPQLLAGRDVIGQARTGSGKTLAFAVPMAECCDSSVRKVQALVLAPTRELAIQVASVTEALASEQGLKVTLLYGGRSARAQQARLRRGPQIVIGTPGRTLDHLRQGVLDLRSVRFLVLDEADEMLDKGFAPDVEAILRRTSADRTTALFSATVPAWVAKTAKKHQRDPVIVAVDADVKSLPSVQHLVYTIKKGDKPQALQTLLNQRDGEPVIVFGRTKHGVRKLARQLDALGYPVGALQGNLSQNARERVMTAFRSGATPILVATNVAARGLDVKGVDQVINYDLPESQQYFTHRVGRTGRMGRAGEAVTFITPDEESKWREIERGLGRRFTRKPWRKAA
ncbi:MAG: DEAD/DEAH box helicase [Gammaproteobacteria bacterium]|nr:DEAD/DEAH box helicase [Gammaproteobacteria bacterium]MYF59011.1 DEAD/DEAH box helicase [Gammaproteobacteria bacterium]